MVTAKVYHALVAALSTPRIALPEVFRSRREAEAEEPAAGAKWRRRGKVTQDQADRSELSIKRWGNNNNNNRGEAEEEARVCYYATGHQAHGFRACDLTADISLCCPVESTCLRDNALCIPTTAGTSSGDGDGDGDDDNDDDLGLAWASASGRTALQRTACTDRDWDEQVCGRKTAQCLG